MIIKEKRTTNKTIEMTHETKRAWSQMKKQWKEETEYVNWGQTMIEVYYIHV